MRPIFLLFAVLLPFAGGAAMLMLRTKTDRWVKPATMCLTVLTSLLTWALVIARPEGALTLWRFTIDLTFDLRLDGLGRFFAAIVATLWPLTVLYAFSYLQNDTRKRSFFAFFTMSYGATLGVALAGDLFTMYCFYELLTLCTVPLVLHTRTKEATRAAKTYFVFSLGGAAFAFASMLFLVSNGVTVDFALGGLLHRYPYGQKYLTYVFYLLGFFGFGVKAAVFPACRWLPKASAAPTPVTALLHAVAVVKAGAFAILRLTYYCYDVNLLRGSWAQWVCMGAASFTIFYGAARAVKETHWKRRLAWSTVANLSYILFGATLMTPAGMSGAMLHMAFHAEIKILAFFCAGAVLCRTGREYIPDLAGLGRKMPVTFGCFTVAAVALVGIPPLAGFVSKWSLLSAAADAGTPMAYLGAGVLLTAALLTAIYMFTTVSKAWFPSKSDDLRGLQTVREADWRMLVPMVLLAAGILVTGLCGEPIARAVAEVVRTGVGA